MIELFLKQRWMVLVGLAGLIVAGVYTMFHLNIEAYPDLTNVQVLVTTETPGMSPVEVEEVVRFPIDRNAGDADGAVGIEAGAFDDNDRV